MNRLSSVWKSILIVLLGFVFALTLLFAFKMVLAWTNPTQAPPGGSGSGISTIPAGTIVSYGGATTPSGWLLCNGSSVSKDTYSALFDAIGYTYGGSGNNFNLPDMRGRVSVGLATGGRAEVNALGDNEGLASTLRNISHYHIVDMVGYNATTPGGGGNAGDPNVANDRFTSGDTSNTDKPAYLVVNCIIKT